MQQVGKNEKIVLLKLTKISASSRSEFVRIHWRPTVTVESGTPELRTYDYSRQQSLLSSVSRRQTLLAERDIL
jgi:hypothetical protein